MSRSRTWLPGLVALVALLAPASAQAVFFGGAHLTYPGATFALTHGGPAFPRVSCPPRTFLWCTGTIVLRTSGGRVIGRAPIAVGGNDNPTVEVPISPAGRRLVSRTHRLRVVATIRAHDTLGQWRRSRGVLFLVPPR